MTRLDDMTSVELHEWCSRPFKDEIAKLRAEIEGLRALLKRHDDLCRKDESVGNDYVWTPELKSLVEDTRAALKDTKP